MEINCKFSTQEPIFFKRFNFKHSFIKLKLTLPMSLKDPFVEKPALDKKLNFCKKKKNSMY